MGNLAAFFEIGSAPFGVHAQVAREKGINRKTAGLAFIGDLHEDRERTIPRGVVTVHSERSDINSQSLPTQSGA